MPNRRLRRNLGRQSSLQVERIEHSELRSERLLQPRRRLGSCLQCACRLTDGRGRGEREKKERGERRTRRNREGIGWRIGMGARVKGQKDNLIRMNTR